MAVFYGSMPSIKTDDTSNVLETCNFSVGDRKIADGGEDSVVLGSASYSAEDTLITIAIGLVGSVDADAANGVAITIEVAIERRVGVVFNSIVVQIGTYRSVVAVVDTIAIVVDGQDVGVIRNVST